MRRSAAARGIVTDTDDGIEEPGATPLRPGYGMFGQEQRGFGLPAIGLNGFFDYDNDYDYDNDKDKEKEKDRGAGRPPFRHLCTPSFIFATWRLPSVSVAVTTAR